MPGKNWKRARARSICHGIELCLDFAREKGNLSVDRVADLMGLPNKWVLYKWMESGRMPANLIPPFEHACGASFVTDYLGGVIGGVLIKMPTGRKSGPEEVAALQHSFADAIQQLAQFYDGKRGAEETIDALTSALRGAAWHRENVAKLATPELALFDEAQT